MDNEIDNKTTKLYPLKFIPIYQHRMWGGSYMTEMLSREVPAPLKPVGESWEMVDREDFNSVVADGALAGVSLHELMERFGQELVGPKGRNAKRFPLLVKIIDAGERLSLQVHPDDDTCRKIGGNAEPKTEMWYILGADKNGKILAGLNSRATKIQVSEMINKPEVENLLQVYSSQVGDAYFISSGTLHAIGEGNLILEVQQNSDTTYRVSDWGRVDQSGKARELHIEKGMESINFFNRTSPRICAVVGEVSHNRKYSIINQCPFFVVDVLHLNNVWYDNTTSSGSCHMITATDGSIKISTKTDTMTVLNKGETALIPFACGDYVIEPLQEGNAVVLRTTL